MTLGNITTCPGGDNRNWLIGRFWRPERTVDVTSQAPKDGAKKEVLPAPLGALDQRQ